jgi:hypothetical protein
MTGIPAITRHPDMVINHGILAGRHLHDKEIYG